MFPCGCKVKQGLCFRFWMAIKSYSYWPLFVVEMMDDGRQKASAKPSTHEHVSRRISAAHRVGIAIHVFVVLLVEVRRCLYSTCHCSLFCLKWNRTSHISRRSRRLLARQNRRQKLAGGVWWHHYFITSWSFVFTNKNVSYFEWWKKKRN